MVIMSFKRKNTKPTRVSESSPGFEVQDGLSPVGISPTLSPNDRRFDHFFHQHAIAKPPHFTYNEMAAHMHGVPFGHNPRYPHQPLAMSLDQPTMDHGNPAPWQVSLSLPNTLHDPPTMVPSTNGANTSKWQNPYNGNDYRDHNANEHASTAITHSASGGGNLQPDPKWEFSNANNEIRQNNEVIPQQSNLNGIDKMDSKPTSQPPAKKSRKIKFKYQNKSTADVKYKCDLCEYCTNRSDHYKRHVMTHSEEKPLKCGTCGYGTGRSDHFRRHLLRHGLNKDEIVMQCELNGIKTVAPSQSQSNHIRLQPPPKPVQENENLTSSYNAMNVSSTLNESAKKFRCDVCGYATDRSSHYHRHLKTHSDDRPFHCGKCGRKFKLETYLKKHRCSMRPLADDQPPVEHPQDGEVSPKAAPDPGLFPRHPIPNTPVCTGCGMWFSRFADFTNHICPHLVTNRILT
uniref:Zinc finger protein ZF(C2H2)-70 n=1 Tax=Phallusia mammillata TaxID=59560 RepID=A0A6F9DWU1_9ASCI|nr:zinc finger protein ZF(C2H2)-70 [Phallusia mammillata]